MKINSQVKMSVVLISLMALVMGFQNCAGTTVGNPYVGDIKNTSDNLPGFDFVGIKETLSTANSVGLKSLSFCIIKIEFYKINTLKTKVHTINTTIEFSILSEGLEIDPELPSSPTINAAQFYVSDSCMGPESVKLTTKGSEYSANQTLNFYVPMTTTSTGSYQFNFQYLANAVVNVTSDAELINALQTLDISSLPLITTY